MSLTIFTNAMFRWPAGSSGEPQIYVVGPRNCGKTTVVSKLLEAFKGAGRLPSDTLLHTGDFTLREVQYLLDVPVLRPNGYVVLFKGSVPESCKNARCVPVARARSLMGTLGDFEAFVYDSGQDAFKRAAL